MKPVRDASWQSFTQAAAAPWFKGQRVKARRHEPLTPGGRCRLTLFEAPGPNDRAHPRLRTEMPPVVDPTEHERLCQPPEDAPADLDSIEALFRQLIAGAAPRLQAGEVPQSYEFSPQYYRNSLRAQRLTRLFAELRGALAAWIARGSLGRGLATPCRALLRRLEAEQRSGELAFDDGDTGTYHSFGHDKPFVHFLQAMLDALPAEGSAAFALLGPDQQASVRRQRAQARNHLDHLMRHKYAHDGIIETDIERSLGGLLIDRATRSIVSETPESREGLVPAYELLRVDPAADHPHAGAWVYRDGEALRLQSGEAVQVDPEDLRRAPLGPSALTFQRAPGDARLRRGIRLDWDGSGYVRQGKVEWVSWAGHCDIKAIMEALGLTFDGPPGTRPSLTEHRSDTGQTTTYTRDLLIEMIASSMELGSVYERADGTGRVVRGVHRFGGARNDSRPDRLQFEGLGQGRHFRWPLSTRQESFVVTSLELDGQARDMDAVFLKQLPDTEALDFKPNPRYLRTVEGDYNLIDVRGGLLRARARIDRFDPLTGYLEQEAEDLVLDLRPEASARRQLLGTHVKDAGRRELYKVWLDLDAGRIEAIPERWERGEDGRFAPRALPGDTVRVPLRRGFGVTLSREMKNDDPSLFQSLLDIAVRQGQNICADTDEAAEVWNGVVTHIHSRRVGFNPDTRVEHWQIEVRARFGRATLEYLLRLDAEGHSEAWCPVPGKSAPDFLWQDFPDVGSKGKEAGAWVINQSMLARGIVEKVQAPWDPSGVYVHDDQIKNVYEILWAALSGHRHSIVHDNKRYVFADAASWEAAVRELEALRGQVRFEGAPTS